MVPPYPSPPPSSPSFSPQQIAYQQAAAWVQMVNTLTWTLASAYLLASAWGLTAALNEKNGHILHILLSFTWLVLLVIWVLIDKVYLASARHARKVLEAIEDNFPHNERFFRSQKEHGFGGHRINQLLYSTAAVFAVAWLIVLISGFADMLEKKPTPDISGGKCTNSLLTLPHCPKLSSMLHEENDISSIRADENIESQKTADSGQTLSSIRNPEQIAERLPACALRECNVLLESYHSTPAENLEMTPFVSSRVDQSNQIRSVPRTQFRHRNRRQRCDMDKLRSHFLH